MEVLDHIVDLPTDINIALFCEWTDMPDLANFDSAMCNKEKRKTFLLLLFADQSFVIQGFDHTIQDKGLMLTSVKFNNWVYIRLLKFRKVLLVGPDEIIRCSDKSCDLNKINCLEFVSMEPNQDVLEAAVVLINSCRSLNRLVLWCLENITAIFQRVLECVLGRLKELYVYDQPCDPLTVQFVESIASSCTVLTCLNLGDRSNGSEVVVYQIELVLKKNPLLKSIKLINGQIGDSILMAVALHCPHVKYVKIEGGKDITIGAVVALQSARANTLLNLLVITRIGRGAFMVHGRILSIQFSFGSLDDERVVRVTDLPDLSSTLIMRGVFQQRHPITKLVLNSIPLTSDMLLMMANSSPKLRLLAIDSCGVLFSKDAVKRLLNACCESLTHLHLGDCHHFTPDDLIGLVAVAGKRLRVMSIVRHPDITPADVSKIISSCALLEVMCLCQCSIAHNWNLYKYLCCVDPMACKCTRSVPKMLYNFDSKMFDKICVNK